MIYFVMTYFGKGEHQAYRVSLGYNIVFSYNGKVYAETDLLALNDVSASWFLTAQRRVSDFFAKPLVRILLIVVVLLIVALVVYVTMFSRRRRYGHRRRGAAHGGYRGRRRRF